MIIELQQQEYSFELNVSTLRSSSAIMRERAQVCLVHVHNSLAVHVKETSHDISWENAKVLQEKQHKIRRKIKEAIEIQKTPCMNMDLGMNVDPIRKDILN